MTKSLISSGSNTFAGGAISEFTDEFLEALGAWQNGWGTDQAQRKPLGERIARAATALPTRFKTTSGQTCYRKRFIHTGELESTFIDDLRDEDVGSWTLNLDFARAFRGLKSQDSGAITAAIFQCIPSDEEVVVNVPELWKDSEFVAAATSYRDRGCLFAAALFHFLGERDQSEVILTAPLRGSEIFAVSGEAKSFDEYCDMLEYPGGEFRDELYRRATDQGISFGDLRYIQEAGAKRVSETVSRTGKSIKAINEAVKVGQARAVEHPEWETNDS